MTTAEDEHVSSSRSKRLLSGYLFGDPRAEELGTRPSSPALSAEGIDSPPVTEADPAEIVRSFGQTGAAFADDGIARPGEASGSGKRNGSRRSSKSRDRESGWDALNGLNDGEADLDEDAPQGEGGTDDYLSGMKEYCFPRHRLRTSMKGKSKRYFRLFATC